MSDLRSFGKYVRTRDTVIHSREFRRRTLNMVSAVRNV